MILDNSTPFIHLRNHTAYSIAEGALSISSIVEFCKKYEMPAVAITDTNNIFGGVKFSTTMVDKGIQPIFGTQLSVDFNLPTSIFDKKELSELVLLVKNDVGYRNLIKLLSIAYTQKLDTDPPGVSESVLYENTEGLIVLSGGVNGVIGKCLLAEQEELAENFCLKLNKVFHDNFYMEIQRHGSVKEANTESKFLDFAMKYNIPVVATNECFFINKDMYTAHEALLCIKNGTYYDDTTREKKTVEHYFKSQEEMKSLFFDLPEAIINTSVIASRCSYIFKKVSPLLPHVEKGIDEISLLKEKSITGLEERLLSIGVTDNKEKKIYFDRLEYELEIIIKMKFPGYFLIVSDFIRWAKNQEIPVGPGRGSGAGSVVAWALKITDINPLRFGLLFERFLNPERQSMPDFDIDFCEERRGEVIHYVQEKYGFDSVGQIITFGKLKSKNAIKDVGRILRVSYTICDNLCKLIPDKLTIVLDDGSEKDLKLDDITISICMKYLPKFSEMVSRDENLEMVVDLAMKLEGLYKSTGMHAAGVVIGDRPLDQLVALYKTDKSDLPVVQYDMKFIETTGLIKYDFLGLKTLTIIKKACDLIYKNYGLKMDMSNIPFDDKPTFELLTLANTVGVFQLESRGMQNVVVSLKPDRIEDIVALVALFRPGPMENIPLYIARKFGEKVEYLNPKIEPILKETYGIMVYQEQVMEMAKQLAGYSLGSADILRRAMGKKNPVEMAANRDIFVNGCLKYSNINKEVSSQIFDSIEQFANYGFNKSHAVCYAVVSYQTAYLKTHYTPEFMAACMTEDVDDIDRIAVLSENVKSMGIDILRPDINKSYDYFSVEDKNIRYAFSAIKGIGVGFSSFIVEEREKNGEFKSFSDFVFRVNGKLVNKRILENLIKAGAFDSLDANRNKLFTNVPYIMSYITSLDNEKETSQSNLFAFDLINIKRADFVLSEVIDWKSLEKLNNEKEVIGFYISSHPLDIYKDTLNSLNAKNLSDVSSINIDTVVSFGCIVERVDERISKAGKQYLSVKVSDQFGIVNVLFFASKKLKPKEQEDYFNNIKSILLSDKPILIESDLKYNSEKNNITLFAKNCQILKFDIQFTGDLNLILSNPDSIIALYKIFESIYEGGTTIYLNVKTNDKFVRIKLLEKKLITPESLLQIKNLNGVVIEFINT